jgi:NitT/TauT family transport system ATP-binding protein
MTVPVLQVRALGVTVGVSRDGRDAGRRLLDDVAFDVAPGSSVGVVGESGAGKSTLGLALMRLLTPEMRYVAGTSVRLDDCELATLDDEAMREVRGRRIAMVFQEPITALDPAMTIGDQLAEAVLAHGLAPVREARERAIAMLERVGIGGGAAGARRYPHELSGGMRQRAAIARALVLDPKILLMDEPFAALDAQTRQMLQVELQAIWQKTKKTIFFVTHNVREATFLSDRVLEITARPGTVKKEYPIHIPRPRHEQDPHLLTVQTRIMGSLKDEIEKVAKEQLDADYEVSKGGLLTPVDKNVGSNI